jgi:hypothetical protein
MTLRVTLRVLAMLLAMLLERCMRRCVRVTMNADCACTRVPVPACLYPRALRVTLAHPQFRQRLHATSSSSSFRCQIIQMTLRVLARSRIDAAQTRANWRPCLNARFRQSCVHGTVRLPTRSCDITICDFNRLDSSSDSGCRRRCVRSHEMRPAAPAHSDARSFRCQIIQMPDHSDDPARDPARPCNAACNAA